MDQKELLEAVIKQKGGCEGVPCEDCCFSIRYGNGEGRTTHRCRQGRFELPEERYKKAVEMYIKEYGNDSLVDELL